MGVFVFRFPVPENQLYDVGNWHSPYYFLAFFQARIALFESFGVTQQMIKEAGFAVVVEELYCKYRKPLMAGDIALIEIFPIELGESRMIFSCKVRKEDDSSEKIRAEGRTVQILIDRNEPKRAPLPDWIRKPLAEMIEGNTISKEA